MKYKQWRVAPPCPEGQLTLERAGLPTLLAGLLAARGVTRPEQARRLLTPETEFIPDPMLLRDMDRAARRVRLALERGEHIAVYGDYDVDGITTSLSAVLTSSSVRRPFPLRLLNTFWSLSVRLSNAIRSTSYL